MLPILLPAALAGLGAVAAEVLWVRLLGRSLGDDLPALSVVSVALLPGFVVGGILGGWRAQRSRRPAHAAAAGLATAGVLVGITPWALPRLLELHAMVSLGVLSLVSLLLGASLPHLVRARVTSVRRAGGETGLVYGLWGLGGAAGVAAGVAGLAVVGERATVHGAGMACLVAALLVLLLERAADDAAAEGEPPAEGADAAGGRRGLLGALVAGLAVLMAGAAGLGGGATWLHLLLPLAGDPLFAGGLLLLLALAAGGLGVALGGLLADRLRQPAAGAALLLALGGVAFVAALPLHPRLPAWLVASPPAGPARLLALAGMAALTLLPGLLLLAAVFPMAVAARARSAPGAAATAGRLHAMHAVGRLLAALVVGFALAAARPAPEILRWVATGALVTAVLVGVGRSRGGLALAGAAVAVGALLWVAPVWSALAPAGPRAALLLAVHRPLPPWVVVHGSEELEATLEVYGPRPAAPPWQPDGTPMEAYPSEGGWGGHPVEVLALPGGEVAVVRGGTVLGTLASAGPGDREPTATLAGLWGALAAPAEARALVLGDVAGDAAAALEAGGVAEVDHVVPSTAGHDVALAWRGRGQTGPEPKNAGSLRRALATAPEGGYGAVILLDRAAGEGALASREVWQEAARALTPQGVLVQAFDLDALTPALLRGVVAGIQEALPVAWLHRVGGDVVVLASRRRPRIDADTARRGWAQDEALRAVALPAGLPTPGALLRHWVADERGVASLLAGPATVPTDDHPWLQIEHAHRHTLGHPPGASTVGLLDELPAPVVPRLLPDSEARERWVTEAIEAHLDAGDVPAAAAWSAHALDATSAAAKRLRMQLLLARGQVRAAETGLRRLVAETPTDTSLLVAWMRALAARLGEEPGADQWIELARRHAGRVDDARVWMVLGDLHLRDTDLPAAADAYEAALAAEHGSRPAGAGTRLGRMLVALGADERRALDLLREAAGTQLDPEALDLWFRLEVRLGEADRAEEVLAALRRVAARRARTQLRQAERDLRAGRFARAVAGAGEALALDAELDRAVLVGAAAQLAQAGSGRPVPGGPRKAREEAARALAALAARSADPVARRARFEALLRVHGVEDALPEPPKPEPEDA